MKNMKKITMIAAVFFALAFVTAFAGEAMAKPNWVTVKYTGWTFVVNKKAKENASNHIEVRLNFDIINNSKNGDIITAIYNKVVNLNGNFTLEIPYRNTYNGSFPNAEAVYSSVKPNAKWVHTYTNPSKGEWWPGQVYKYSLAVYLNQLIKPVENWTMTNYAFKRVQTKYAKRKPAAPKFNMGNCGMDLQVQSHK